jgi:hypothetical protein
MHMTLTHFSQHKLKGLVALILVFSLFACSRKIAFNTSTVVPGAEGRVKMKKDNNNNYALDLEVKNLADPKRLPLPQNMYVVWIETSDGVKNLGQLRTSSGLLSSTMRASLETVTPFRPTRVFITAENDASISYPNAQVVLATNPF